MSHPETHRPLIDLIPNGSLHVSDEEDAFYAREDDYLINPKWKGLLQRTSNRIPRRVQRYLGVYLILATIAWTGWQLLIGPKYSEHRREIAAMDDTSQPRFGTNVAPVFKEMIQLKTLDNKYLPVDNRRLVVVGDVHGCREELEALLEKVAFDVDNDHLILTGDIINKGPDSPGVVSLAEKLGASSVRGNHEDKLLLTIADMEARETTVPHPAEKANLQEDVPNKESFTKGEPKLHALAQKFSKKEIAWLKQCPVILRVGQVPNMGEVVVVHAGLVPDVPLAQQDPYQVMNMRTIDLKTRVPSETREGTPWEKFWNHRQKKLPAGERTTVIYGHDRKRGMNIEKYSRGIDSGCVGGGHLTALVIDSKGHNKYVQVKCKGYVD